MTYAVEVKNLSYSYDEEREKILDDISFYIEKGTIQGIVGLSGSGKTTLCCLIASIIPKYYGGVIEGNIYLYGKNINDMSNFEIVKSIGIVFQDPDTQLFSPTVEDEIAFGPENLCLSKDEIGYRIEKSLSKVGMQKYRYENPNNLSGGEKKLIAVAAVLSIEPDIFIFDETMAQLDKKGREKMKGIIKDLKKEGKTIIMIEHDYENLDIIDNMKVLRKGKIHEK